MRTLRPRALVALATVVLGCGGSDPPSGSVICAAQGRQCPDGFYCDQGTGTCWQNGSGPDGSAPLGDVAIDVAAIDTKTPMDVERVDSVVAVDMSPAEAGILDTSTVDTRTAVDAVLPDAPLSTGGDAPLGTGGVVGLDGAIGTGGVVGTGGVIGSGGGSGTGGTTADTAAPKVISVTPASGTTGVLSNATIAITFSEAMNTSSVEGALTVSNLLSGDLRLTWNSGKTVLSIAALSGFAYATGTSTTTAAKSYSVSLSAAAQDLAGNALSPAFTTSFKTMRRITQTVAAESAVTYDTYAPNVGGNPVACANDADGIFRLGRFSSTSASGTVYNYVGINTSTMGPATTIESADFIASQQAEDGTFYGGGGKVVLDKLAYQTIDDTILDATVTATIGTLATSAAVATPTISILPQFKADVLAGTQRQLYRLSASNGVTNTHPQFTCAGFSYKTTYLMP